MPTSKTAAKKVSRQHSRGRPAKRSNARKVLVREELIDKATDVFFLKGYAQTSMNDIAAELGMRRSSVYYYFASKEDLLAAILEKETTRPYQAIVEVMALPEPGPVEKLRRVVADGIVRRLTDRPRFIVLNRIEAELPPELAARYTRSKRQILDLYTRLVEDGVRSGGLRAVDARMAAFAVIGMANWTSWWYSPVGRLSPEEIAAAILDLAFHGIARSGAADALPDTLGAAVRALKDNVLALERLAG